MKWAIFAAFALLLLGMGFIGTTSAATIHYVPDNYTTIQAAVNAASPGDTVIVRDGTYIENVDVNVDHLTIKSEKGADSTIVHAANPNDHVFEVTEDYVNISGFTVEGTTWLYSDGIYIRANFCNIFNNNVSNNANGICLSGSLNNINSNNISSNYYTGIEMKWSPSNNNINNNDISNNPVGIFVYQSSDNIISNNTFMEDGLYVLYSYQNTVKNNTVNGKPLVYLEDESDFIITDAGQIILVNCNNITAENLDLSNTSVGAELWRTKNSKIMNNNINSNRREGIYLHSSSNNNIISDNNVRNGGIRLYSLSNNNIIRNNNVSGIDLTFSSDNNIIRDNQYLRILFGDNSKRTDFKCFWQI